MKKYIPNLFLLSVICYLLLLISPALLGQLGGTFQSTSVPADYVKLEQFFSKDKTFYRTLWLPQIQRFAFFSNTHPAISANDLFKLNSSKDDISFLNKPNTLRQLQESSVKYVIVPYDSQGEIFLTDRKYDIKVYEKTINDMDYLSFVKKQNTFGKIGVYEIPNPKDHFWSADPNLKISYKFINPTKYQVKLTGAKKGGQLIFAENFDKGWVATGTKIKNQKSKIKNGLNSFVLPENGNYNLEVYYTPQRWVDIGTIISTISLIIVFCLLFFI